MVNLAKDQFVPEWAVFYIKTQKYRLKSRAGSCRADSGPACLRTCE